MLTDDANNNQQNFKVGRRYYLPSVEDVSRVARLGISNTPDPANPNWLAIKAKLTASGHTPAELREMTPPELLALLEELESASPTPSTTPTVATEEGGGGHFVTTGVRRTVGQASEKIERVIDNSERGRTAERQVGRPHLGGGPFDPRSARQFCVFLESEAAAFWQPHRTLVVGLKAVRDARPVGGPKFAKSLRAFGRMLRDAGLADAAVLPADDSDGDSLNERKARMYVAVLLNIAANLDDAKLKKQLAALQNDPGTFGELPESLETRGEELVGEWRRRAAEIAAPGVLGKLAELGLTRDDARQVMEEEDLSNSAKAFLRPILNRLDSDDATNEDIDDAPAGAERGEGGTAPADPYTDLRNFARDKLKGQERAVIEALCDSHGELPIADLAVKDGVGWNEMSQGFKDVQRRLKPKLKKVGWELSRQDNAAKLKALKRG